MDSDLLSGVFGLLGAIVGGSFTAFVAFRAQKHEEEKRRLELSAQSEAEARVSARILQAETQTCLIRLSRALRTGRWWPEGFSLPLEPWPAYRERVARYMPLESWQQVSVWFQTAAATQASATHAHLKNSGGESPLVEHPVTRHNIKVAIDRAEAALAALERFTGDRLPPPPDLDDAGDEQ